ncbi:MAG TPA: hypothetical protein VKB03_09960 [Conexibacter sp.]|nr:hypothetical protein [Conexibacter sp.]
MSRSIGVVLVMLLVAMAVAACGSAGDDGAGRTVATTTARTQPAPTDTSETASDVETAKRSLVRLADLPDGWSASGGTVTRLQCGTLQPFRGADALVRSKRLTYDHYGVQERVAIFPDEAAARAALRRLDSRIAAGCLRRELRRHVSEEAGGPASPARLVRAERMGPNSTTRRYISISVSSYGKVIGYIDAVHVRMGRALGALVFVSGPAPPEVPLYERIVEIAPRRLQATLG